MELAEDIYFDVYTEVSDHGDYLQSGGGVRHSLPDIWIAAAVASVVAALANGYSRRWVNEPPRPRWRKCDSCSKSGKRRGRRTRTWSRHSEPIAGHAQPIRLAREMSSAGAPELMR